MGFFDFLDQLDNWIFGDNTSKEFRNTMNSVSASLFGTELTGAEREQNAFNAEQADIAYNRQLYMDNTKMQRAVQDYKAAGLNPYALAGGTLSAPSVSAASGSAPSAPSFNLGQLFELIQLPRQLKKLSAETKLIDKQAENVEADTTKKENESNETVERTRGAKLVNDFYEQTSNIRATLLGDEHERNLWERNVAERDVTVKEAAQAVVEENAKHYNSLLDAQKALVEEQHTTEGFKQAELQALAREANANAVYKNAMLSLDKKIAVATEEKTKEEAELIRTEARIKNKIYTKEYIESILTEAGMKAEIATTVEAYNRGDYSRASKSLQKAFKQLEKDGKHGTYSYSSSVYGSTVSFSNNGAAAVSALPTP